MNIAAFLLALIAIFVAAKLLGALAERLGQPAVLGELIGGAIVGVSGLHLVDPHDPTISLLAQLGIILLLFLIGLETELDKLLEVGGAAAVVAIAGVIATFAGGYALAHFLGLADIVAVFLGASLTATSVGISARVLSDLGHLQDRESQIILAAAVVDDIIGVVLLTLIGRMADQGDLGPMAVARVTVTAFGFVAVALIAGSWLAPLLVRAIDRIRVARALFFASIVFALSLAYVAQRIGSAIIIGSFAAGLVLARTEKGEQIEREVHDVAHFFVPIFFVAVGAAIDLRTMTVRYVLIGLGLAAIAIVGKLLAGSVTPGRGLRRAIIGTGMIPRGEVSLIFAQIGLTSGLLTAGLFNSVTVMVIVTAFLTPILLRAQLKPVSITVRAGDGSPDIPGRRPSHPSGSSG